MTRRNVNWGGRGTIYAIGLIIAFTVLAVVAIRLAAPSGKASPSATGHKHAHLASHAEREWHTGANTFSDPHHASGMGPKIAPGQHVLVSCKIHDPSIVSANPGGYWYRIASSPWDNRFYALANTFLNGDAWGGPYTHPTDLSVPDC